MALNWCPVLSWSAQVALHCQFLMLKQGLQLLLRSDYCLWLWVSGQWGLDRLARGVWCFRSRAGALRRVWRWPFGGSCSKRGNCRGSTGRQIRSRSKKARICSLVSPRFHSDGSLPRALATTISYLFPAETTQTQRQSLKRSVWCDPIRLGCFADLRWQ